jgi:eukaryotic translation initiation factor 2C
MCYSYSPATRAISYAAPAYYADKLCTRGRCYLQNWDKSVFPAVRGKNETEEAFYSRVATEVQSSQFWSMESLRTEDQGVDWGNPWRKTIKDVMFYV